MVSSVGSKGIVVADSCLLNNLFYMPTEIREVYLKSALQAMKERYFAPPDMVFFGDIPNRSTSGPQ